MENIKIHVTNGVLFLEIDLTKDQGLSKSGKSTIIASTHGNVDIPEHEGYKLGLNIFKNIKR